MFVLTAQHQEASKGKIKSWTWLTDVAFVELRQDGHLEVPENQQTQKASASTVVIVVGGEICHNLAITWVIHTAKHKNT